MLSGRVTPEREAVLSIAVVGPTGKRELLEAMVDTGYNGFLTLPSWLVAALDLSSAGTARATLGDGSEVSLDLFLATLDWPGDPREVLVLQAEGGVLLGMAAMMGSRLTVDVVDDGAVTVRPLVGR
jgi:predicted aspartyl protease